MNPAAAFLSDLSDSQTSFHKSLLLLCLFISKRNLPKMIDGARKGKARQESKGGVIRGEVSEGEGSRWSQEGSHSCSDA